MPHSLLPEAWNVPRTLRDRLGEGAGRQRAMFADDHLLLVLHSVPSGSDLHRKGRFFWREPEGTWHADGEGTGIDMLMRHVKTYEDAIVALEKKEESAQQSSTYFEILTVVVPLRRAARHLHVTLQNAREKVPVDRGLIACRDAAGNVERGAELVSAEAHSGLEYAMARHAEIQERHNHQMAVSSHRLNRLAAIFFPIATVAAVFGVNLRSGLEDAYAPMLFWGMVGSTIVLGLVLNALMMQKPK